MFVKANFNLRPEKPKHDVKEAKEETSGDPKLA